MIKYLFLYSFCSLLLTNNSIGQQNWKGNFDSVRTVSGDLSIIYKNGKSGLANEKTGKVIIAAKYDYISPSFNEGLAVVELNDKYGHIDKTGKLVTPIKYEVATPFSGGLARIMNMNNGDYKWGFVNKAGKEINFKYNSILGYANGYGIAEVNKKYFLVNSAGKETPLPFEKVGYEKFGLLLVKQNNKYGFINCKAEVVIPIKYDNAWDFDNYNTTGYLSNVKLGTKYGFIDTTGKEIVPIKYDFANLFREGRAAVKLNGPSGGSAYDDKWGYVDSTGKEVIPLVYNSAGYFKDGLAAVKQNGKYGFIDPSGKVVIPLIYTRAEEFSDGLAAVKLNDKYGFIDKSGKEVIPFKFEDVIKGFERGRATVVLNGQSVKINKKGEVN